MLAEPRQPDEVDILTKIIRMTEMKISVIDKNVSMKRFTKMREVEPRQPDDVNVNNHDGNDHDDNIDNDDQNDNHENIKE